MESQERGGIALRDHFGNGRLALIAGEVALPPTRVVEPASGDAPGGGRAGPACSRIRGGRRGSAAPFRGPSSASGPCAGTMAGIRGRLGGCGREVRHTRRRRNFSRGMRRSKGVRASPIDSRGWPPARGGAVGLSIRGRGKAAGLLPLTGRGGAGGSCRGCIFTRWRSWPGARSTACAIKMWCKCAGGRHRRRCSQRLHQRRRSNSRQGCRTGSLWRSGIFAWLASACPPFFTQAVR